MARRRFTARKRVRRGSSPEEYVRAYQTYRRCHGDSLGEFLAHFQRLWWDAAFHGNVTGYDGIVRLLSLLPDGWREWATMVAEEYIVTAYPAYDLVGDFPRFLSAVFTRFVCYGSFPPPMTDSPVPGVRDPLAPVAPQPTPGHPSQRGSEAGPSHPPAGRRTPTLPRAPQAQPPTCQDPTSLTEAERRAQEAARKGKAPVTDSDEEEDPPVVAPVGSSHLQTITVPSSYSHSHPAAEDDRLDMGRRMVSVDAIWPNLRETRVETAPPAPTEESLEDPHLMWKWVCGEDEDNPILVDSNEEQEPKEERPSDSEELMDGGYYTTSGKWVWY